MVWLVNGTYTKSLAFDLKAVWGWFGFGFGLLVLELLEFGGTILL